MAKRAQRALHACPTGPAQRAWPCMPGPPGRGVAWPVAFHSVAAGAPQASPPPTPPTTTPPHTHHHQVATTTPPTHPPTHPHPTSCPALPPAVEQRRPAFYQFIFGMNSASGADGRCPPLVQFLREGQVTKHGASLSHTVAPAGLYPLLDPTSRCPAGPSSMRRRQQQQ